MPHSSGGGSHGGGSHGGHGGGGGSSYSRSYYNGCKHRYVYYRNKAPVYIYSDKSIEELQKPPHILVKIILCLWLTPYILAGFTMIGQAFHNPKPLRMDYDTSIYIEDRLGILEDEERLASHLEDFKNKTGITPAVITVSNSDWKFFYSDLEKYAYELYVNKFSDEKHWLIVYSQPDTLDSQFNDWYFEGMQGDDTDPIITTGVGNTFTQNLHKYLLQDTKWSVEEAIEKAFDEQTETIMDSYFIAMYFVLGVSITGLNFFLIYGVLTNRAIRKIEGLTETTMATSKAEAKSMETTCEYCGGIYVVTSTYHCPHCGALTKLGYDKEGMM